MGHSRSTQWDTAGYTLLQIPTWDTAEHTLFQIHTHGTQQRFSIAYHMANTTLLDLSMRAICCVFFFADT